MFAALTKNVTAQLLIFSEARVDLRMNSGVCIYTAFFNLLWP